MTRPVYTIDFGSSPVEIGGIWESFSPPDGFIWVLRNLDITVDNTLFDAFAPPQGVIVYGGAFQEITRTDVVYGGNVGSFHWEGRSIIIPGQVIITSGFPYNGTVNAVGFQLSVP
jgi:hypothetical protein